MPWTTAARAREWVAGLSLTLEPAALNQSLSDAEDDLYSRLIQFICKTTVDTWTDTTNTPDLVQQWTARMTAAVYLAKYQGYHLRPEIPDNPAANLYADVLKEVESAKHSGTIIVDQTGAVVPVNGITVSHSTQWAFYLPISQGGEVDSD